MTAESVGGYWQRQLVEILKREGQSQEVLDGLDAELERGLHGGFELYFGSKEELARSIVQLYDMPPTSKQELDQISSSILALAEDVPVKKAKLPYYQKNKSNWWK